MMLNLDPLVSETQQEINHYGVQPNIHCTYSVLLSGSQNSTSQSNHNIFCHLQLRPLVN